MQGAVERAFRAGWTARESSHAKHPNGQDQALEAYLNADLIEPNEAAQATLDPLAGPEMRRALEETGCATVDELIDAALIGQSFMERLSDLTGKLGPFHNWAPADDPAEIIFDLVNHYEAATHFAPAAVQESGA